MKKYPLYLGIMFIPLLISCMKTEVKNTDPCQKSPKVCWGMAGTNPSSVSVCQRLIECHNWEIKEKN